MCLPLPHVMTQKQTMTMNLGAETPHITAQPWPSFRSSNVWHQSERLNRCSLFHGGNIRTKWQRVLCMPHSCRKAWLGQAHPKDRTVFPWVDSSMFAEVNKVATSAWTEIIRLRRRLQQVGHNASGENSGYIAWNPRKTPCSCCCIRLIL